MLEPATLDGKRVPWSRRSPRAGSRLPSPTYQPRRPCETLLYRIVERHLGELVELAADSCAKPLPRYVLDELQVFLT